MRMTVMKLFTGSLAAALFLVAGLPLAAADLSSLPLLKDYAVERASSSDSTGANDDGNWKNPIKAGETRTIAELSVSRAPQK